MALYQIMQKSLDWLNYIGDLKRKIIIFLLLNAVVLLTVVFYVDLGRLIPLIPLSFIIVERVISRFIGF
jgi:hypothetical protein